MQSRHTPFLSMPTHRHLVKWQALLLCLVISHSLEAAQLYSMLPWMVLMKKALQDSQDATVV
ncbi:hypothetical protein P7K49_040049, partial [Saguinus oedipus]